MLPCRSITCVCTLGRVEAGSYCFGVVYVTTKRNCGRLVLQEKHANDTLISDRVLTFDRGRTDFDQ